MKLLNFADRRALLQWGRPITFDWFVSMPHGPVLSFTLDKINDAAPPDGSSYWHRVISERKGNEVSLVGQVPNDQLSTAEEQLLDAVFRDYGGMSQWEIRDFSHSLPELAGPERIQRAHRDPGHPAQRGALGSRRTRGTGLPQS